MLKEKIVHIPEGEKPEDVIENELEPVELDLFVAQIFSEVETENYEDRMKRYKKWAKNRAFYRGNQRGVWDASKRAWVTVDIDTLTPSEQSMLVTNNQFRPQVKTLAKEFSRSQTRIRSNAQSDSQRAVLASRFADNLIKYYQPRLLPETQRQLRAKFLMLCGNVFHCTKFSRNKKSANVQVQVNKRAMLPAYTSSVCSECGYEPEEEVKKCPECGGIVETTNVEAKEADGVAYETINAGDPDIEVVDPAEVEVWSGAKNLALSPYLRRRRIVKEAFIKAEMPWYKIQNEGTLSESGQMQMQFFDTANSSEDNQKNIKRYEYEELWIDLSMYVNKKLEKPVEFKRKKGNKWQTITLPVGTVLKDEFPDGMYALRIGGAAPVCYYNEDKDTCWKHTAYDINIDSIWGDGLEDAVMNQQIINEYTSLSVENVLYNASPKLVINPELINPVTVTNRPKDMLVLSNNARLDTDPKNAFAQVQGMQLTQEVLTGIDTMKRDMREQTGALVAFNGQGDPTLTTATAMSIARDSALALVSTPLSILAETDQELFKEVLRIVKKHWYDKKYSFLLGKYNEEEAKAFKECNIDEELNIFVESNSWMPQTNYERLQNLGAYLTAFGIPMGFLNPQIPEPVRTYASQLYNVPFDFDELAPDIRIAQKRLNIGKEVAAREIPKAMAMLQQMGPSAAEPIMVNEQPSTKGEAILQGTRTIISDAIGIEEDIDDLQIFITEYVKYLKTDEGQNAHPVFREAVKDVISQCKAFLKVQQAEEAERLGMMSQGLSGGPPAGQPEQNQFKPSNPAEHPFAPQKVGQVKDYSDNAKNLQAK